MESICEGIVQAIQVTADEYLPKSKGGRKYKIVPWWNEECASVVRKKRKAFKKVKQTHNFQDLIKYKQLQADVRRIVRKAKVMYWKLFCNGVGNNTPIEEVWGMMKKMRGIQKSKEYPVLSMEGEIAAEDGEKVEMFLKTFVKINSTENLTEQSKEIRKDVLKEYPDLLRTKETEHISLDLTFFLSELRNTVRRMKQSAPGMDGVSYTMMKHFSDSHMKVILSFYNRI